MLPLCECGCHGVGKAGKLFGIVSDSFSPYPLALIKSPLSPLYSPLYHPSNATDNHTLSTPTSTP